MKETPRRFLNFSSDIGVLRSSDFQLLDKFKRISLQPIILPIFLTMSFYFSLLSKSSLLLLFLFSLAANAQYHPFPLENSKWINKERTYTLDQNNFPVYSNSWIDKYCIGSSDTIVNAKSYSKVSFCTSLSSEYHGAMRYETGLLYFIPKDSVSEYLLYDFTKDPGDSVKVLIQMGSGIYPEYYRMMVYINSVDTVIVNGTSRRRLSTQSGYEWIEGIGCVSGLFMEPWFNISNYIRELVCLSVNDTTIFNSGILSQGVAGACNLSLATEELQHNPEWISIYPNPSKGFWILRMDNYISIDKIKVYNAFGQQVKISLNSSNNDQRLEVHGNSGVYYLFIELVDGTLETQKLIKS